MTYPLVSVSIPTYNSAAYIKECLDSVLEQDYPNIEIIVSDDASTDDTVSILLDYQSKHSSIKLNFNKTNLGITKNCNVILSLCKGKYIAFFAGDDVMLPEKIKQQVEYMEKNTKCTISYHNAEVFFTNDPTNKKSYLHHHMVKPRSGDVNVSIKYGPFNAACSSMVRRDKIPLHGFDERLEVASDGLFWIETLEMGGEIHYINKVLARYRIHGQNSSRTKINELALDFLVHQSKLLIKYPEQASDILYNFSDSLFFIAKTNPKSIHYLKASFRIKKRFKVLALILIYYISFGKLSLNSKYFSSLNQLIVRMRARFNMIKQEYFAN